MQAFVFISAIIALMIANKFGLGWALGFYALIAFIIYIIPSTAFVSEEERRKYDEIANKIKEQIKDGNVKL